MILDGRQRSFLKGLIIGAIAAFGVTALSCFASRHSSVSRP